MPRRRDTRRHLGPWLVAEIATRFDLAPTSARAVVAFVLEHVVVDVRNLAAALGSGDPDLEVAARALVARLGYSGDRFGSASS